MRLRVLSEVKSHFTRSLTHDEDSVVLARDDRFRFLAPGEDRDRSGEGEGVILHENLRRKERPNGPNPFVVQFVQSLSCGHRRRGVSVHPALLSNDSVRD